ncbi:MAG: hypothetical protein ACRDH8_13010 [Actinomycetota bacterium]
MAWTAPRTWVTSEVVTASVMNTHVRDNETFLRGGHGCRAYRGAAGNINNSTDTTIGFESESHDTDGYHDPITNTGRFTIPSTLAGYYDIYAQYLLATASGSRIARIRLDGSTTLAEQQTAAQFGAQVFTTEYLTAGQYVELQVWQNSGGGLALLTGRQYTFMQLMLRGN